LEALNVVVVLLEETTVFEYDEVDDDVGDDEDVA
jgi:hypothetical protein